MSQSPKTLSCAVQRSRALSGEHGLDEGDDEAAVEDEMGEGGGAQVAVAAVPQDEGLAVGELQHGEVRCQCSVLALL